MIEQISAAELDALRKSGPVTLIDVREQWEFESGHVPGAEWIPMALVPLRVDDFTARQPLYIICRTGNRSGQVVMFLAQRGVRAVNVDGGTEAWQRLGLPLETRTAERSAR
jgi:rhodanese-related sulfurtransferase